MWLAFAVDEVAAIYFVGVISGPRAYSMALWMRNKTIGGVPLLDAEFNQPQRRYAILQAHVVNIVPVNQSSRHKDVPNADPFSNMPPPGPSTA